MIYSQLPIAPIFVYCHSKSKTDEKDGLSLIVILFIDKLVYLLSLVMSTWLLSTKIDAKMSWLLSNNIVNIWDEKYRLIPV